jgi:Predicted membrane protein (DUF2232)
VMRFSWQIGLVGLGAGACSALLFASMLSKSILAIGLFYLAPLPILIVAVGWSHWAGLLAALAAAVSLTLAIDSFYFLAYLISIGLPAWWLGYLALLARPAGGQGDQGDQRDIAAIEWYPTGRLVVWAAVLGALVVLIGLSQIGSDEASIRDTLRRAIEALLHTQMGVPADKPLELPGMANPEVLAMVLPPAAAALTTMTELLNLWLAGRIVRISGRLRRPWPEFSALRFPSTTPIALAAAFGASFLPGTIGLAAGLPAASLLIAYAVLGFAVVHGITRHLPSRGVVLFGIYAAVAVFGWPVLLMTLLGLIDTALDLRGRVAATRGPPPIPPV